eukprot:6546559-Alexandrium_andersonii.AAC.1
MDAEASDARVGATPMPLDAAADRRVVFWRGTRVCSDGLTPRRLRKACQQRRWERLEPRPVPAQAVPQGRRARKRS